MATHIQPEGLSDKGIAGETAAPPVRKGERKFSSGIEIVLLAAFMIVMLFPVVWILETALKTTADIYAVPAKVFSFSPTFEHFQNVFSSDSPVFKGFVNSVIVAFSSTIIATVAGSPPALARRSSTTVSAPATSPQAPAILLSRQAKASHSNTAF